MKVYLAARFRDRDWFKSTVIPDLHTLGIEVTSRWINWLDQPGHEHTFNAVRNEDLPPEVKRSARGTWSQVDLDDIVAADFLIAFTQPPRSSNSRGGRHFEAGFAFALGKPILVVGPSEHNFYDLPEMRHFENWYELYQVITRWKNAGSFKEFLFELYPPLHLR